VTSDRIIVHDYDRVIEREQEKIKDSSKVNEKNKKYILKFIDHCIAENLSKARQRFYLLYLRLIAEKMKKNFKKVTKNDVEKFIIAINKSDQSESTKQAYRVTFKKFWKWLYKTEEDPRQTKWIKTTIRNSNNKVPSVFTQEQLDLMIRNATYSRDKAFLAVLGDLGCRIGEILSCRVKHLVFHNNNYRLITNSGKSGENSPLLIRSVPYVISYINQHPKKDDPEAPLWFQVRKKYRVNIDGEGKIIKDRNGKSVKEFVGELKPLSYPSASKMIKNVADRCGIKIRIHPHMFRAFATTQLILRNVPEVLIKKRMGWSLSSKVLSVYQRTTNKDVDDAVLKAYGVIPQEEEKSNLKVCDRCKTPLKNDALACDKCGQILDLELAIKMDREKVFMETLANILRKQLEKKMGKNFIDKIINEENLEKMMRT
jgi:integrase/ribosomal protein L40E